YPPLSTPVPYTTLFRSRGLVGRAPTAARRCAERAPTGVAIPGARGAAHRHGAAAVRTASVQRTPRYRHRVRVAQRWSGPAAAARSEEHTSELQSRENLV